MRSDGSKDICIVPLTTAVNIMINVIYNIQLDRQ